jgi:lipoprotein-anchoring transpeptidase ErfK/SrfK
MVQGLLDERRTQITRCALRRQKSHYFRRFQIMDSVSAAARGRIGGARACSVVIAATVAAVALGFEATPAAARGFLSWFDNDWPRTARKTHGHRVRKTAGAPAARGAKLAEVDRPERPLFVVISIGDQRVSIYNHHGLVGRSAISTGVTGHPTPRGLFTIIGRERFHRSNIYSGAPMPFMQRITWSGIAMHLGVVPGHPASHGCIRLPAGFAARLWGLTKIGERVVISPQEVTPAEFAHPLLPAPKMRTEAYEAAPALDPAQPPAAFAAQPPLVNPLQYADQLKVKATAQAAAAAKIAKETNAAVGLKRQEAARAAAELRAVEAAHASARAKAHAAAKKYDAAVAAATAKQQETIQVAELKAADSNVSGKAEAGRLAKAYEAAAAAKDTAAIAKANVDAALADAAAMLETAKTASAAKAAELADSLRRWQEAKATSDAAADAEKDALARTAPVSVLVSKRDQRIYVRQGLAPVFDAPATVRDPETPLGSHLYIATAVEDGGTSLKWSVVSMPPRVAEERGERRRKTASVEEQVGGPPKPHRSPSSPAEALERVEIAQDVRDRIAERLWTGGSLIISDQPLSGETSAVGTDLTVKVR